MVLWPEQKILRSQLILFPIIFSLGLLFTEWKMAFAKKGQKLYPKYRLGSGMELSSSQKLAWAWAKSKV